MDSFFKRWSNNTLLAVIYTLNIILSLHYYLVVYINSSFLSQFFTDSKISTLYSLGSLINLIFLLNVSRVLNKIGNYRITITALCFELYAVLAFIYSNNPTLITIAFLIHIIAIPIMLFNLDVFLEKSSTEESHTGEIRGTFLTLSNGALVLSPLIVGAIAGDGNFIRVYVVSILFLFPLFFLLRRYFKDFKDTPIARIQLRETVVEFLKNNNLFSVFNAHFILQLFYAYMVIYMPIYLYQYIHFNWSEIGVMFTIMLLPFVLFELPVGELADHKYGEKELMAIGFVIMGVSTLLVSLITVKSIILWTILLFFTRTGASFVEITSDSYFFKQVDDRQTNVISTYRTTRPLGFIMAPIFVTISLQYVPYQYIFFILGCIILTGIYWSSRIVDTK